MASGSSLQTTVHRTLAEERVRTARRLALIRAGGVLALLCLALYHGAWVGLPDWRVYIAILGPYAAISILTVLATFASSRLAYASRFLLPLVDAEMIYLVQSQAIPLSPSPGGVAGFTLGVYVVLVVLAALSLDRVLSAATAVVGILFETMLLSEAHIFVGSQVAAGVLLVLGAISADYRPVGPLLLSVGG
jgi:adenylate cyclase